MKYSIILAIAILCLTFSKVIAEDRVTVFYPLGYKFTAEMMDKMIAKYATGSKAYQIKRTLYCESGYNNIQSYIVKNGIREESFGIAQINLPSHPDVSREQALDPDFSIKWTADNWKTVKWYGYLRSEDKCNII